MTAHFAWLIALLATLATLAAAIPGVRRSTGLTLDKPWPLEAKRPLLTEPERILYARLAQAFPQQIVLAQVQLLQALRFKRGAWNAAIANRISQLSVDFLIVKPDMSIIAAVELDDASHERAQRRAADARKVHALKSAGIPLVRFRVKQIPDVPSIQAALAQASGETA
jgi:very-short-patch-repair endonuclease